MPVKDGLETGRYLLRIVPGITLVMLTAHTDTLAAEKIVAAMRAGFHDYIDKNRYKEGLAQALQFSIGRDAVGRRDQEVYTIDQILGECEAIRELRQMIRDVAPSSASVLILGESGTGKELVAGAHHSSSERAGGTYIRINCAALPETLLESELFGHERGAFTGAVKQKPGRVEEADGGTLFLDEIADMSRPLQAKLLRFLEDGSFTRVGGNRELRVDVRLIAATNGDIAKAITEGRFREDLYHRLNVVKLQMPPLRDRGTDIVMLADHFLRMFNAKMQKDVKCLSQAAKQKLLSHSWPGNVRELRNVIERAVILEGSKEVQADSLPDFSQLAGPAKQFRQNAPSVPASINNQLPPESAGHNAVARARLVQWDDKIGEIWITKTSGTTTQEAKEQIKVTTDELGASLQKSGARAEAAKGAGQRLENSGATVRQAYAKYRKEMRKAVKEDSQSFRNLRRLNAWKRWFGDLFED